MMNFGKNIKNGDYVIYNKNSKLDKVGVGVWEVIDLYDDRVSIRSPINDNTFTTDKNKLININFLKLNELKKLLNNTAYSFIINGRLHTPFYIESDTGKYWSSPIDMHVSEFFNNTQTSKEKINIQTEENEKMSTMKGLINRNTSAAKNGAIISAGNTLNSVVKNKVATSLPKKYRKLAESPIADVVVANIAAVAVGQFASTNRNAKIAADAMMEAAMVNLFNSFNFEKIIAEVLESVDMDGLVDSVRDNG